MGLKPPDHIINTHKRKLTKNLACSYLIGNGSQSSSIRKILELTKLHLRSLFTFSTECVGKARPSGMGKRCPE